MKMNGRFRVVLRLMMWKRNLKIQLPIDEYETFSGYVFGIYCTIPEDNTSFSLETDKLIINVLNVVNHTVEKASVIVKL